MQKKTATFVADVTLTGNIDDGTAQILLVQRQEETETPPPNTEQPPDTEIPPPDIEEPPPGGGEGGGGDTWAPPSWMCKDTRKYTIPSVPRPTYLQATPDPTFKTKITRVTGDPGTAIRNISGGRWGDAARHHYQSDQAWSWDGKLIFLDTNDGGSPSDVFLDGETYEPLFGGKNKPSSADVRWDPANPSKMLCASGSKLIRWDPKAGTQETIQSFSGFSDLTFGPWEGSPSADGDLVVLTSDDRGEAFAYRISDGTKYPTLRASRWGSMDACRISRGGTYMVWSIQEDVVVVTDLHGNEVHTLPDNYVSHFDVTLDASGEEIVVGRVNSSSVGQGSSGLVSSYRLDNGQRKSLQTAKGWSSHTSARSNTFYCVADGTPEGGDYIYNGELIMCALDGSGVYRICHTHSNPDVDYVAQTQPSHSPEGGRVIFASPWGSSNRPVGCYIADFRK